MAPESSKLSREFWCNDRREEHGECKRLRAFDYARQPGVPAVVLLFFFFCRMPTKSF